MIIIWTDFSSVGRAFDCSGLSMLSNGRWFDSGKSDILLYYLISIVSNTY